MLKAANGEVYEEDFQMAKRSYYKDDINFDHLQKQLPLCTDLFWQAFPGVKQGTSVCTVYQAMNTQVYNTMWSTQSFKIVFNNYYNTAERSFSALWNVLTYLFSSMSEQRLNNCMLLHIQKQVTDCIEIAKEFIAINAERKL